MLEATLVKNSLSAAIQLGLLKIPSTQMDLRYLRMLQSLREIKKVQKAHTLELQSLKEAQEAFHSEKYSFKPKEKL